MGRRGPRLVQVLFLDESLEVLEGLVLFGRQVPYVSLGVSLANSAGGGYPVYRHGGWKGGRMEVWEGQQQWRAYGVRLAGDYTLPARLEA